MAKKLNMVFTRGESGTKTISLAEVDRVDTSVLSA